MRGPSQGHAAPLALIPPSGDVGGVGHRALAHGPHNKSRGGRRRSAPQRRTRQRRTSGEHSVTSTPCLVFVALQVLCPRPLTPSAQRTGGGLAAARRLCNEMRTTMHSDNCTADPRPPKLWDTDPPGTVGPIAEGATHKSQSTALQRRVVGLSFAAAVKRADDPRMSTTPEVLCTTDWPVQRRQAPEQGFRWAHSRAPPPPPPPSRWANPRHSPPVPTAQHTPQRP